MFFSVLIVLMMLLLLLHQKIALISLFVQLIVIVETGVNYSMLSCDCCVVK